ncbi:hypothetical protein FXN63_13435 [Pigmentiphaga aceris]|uniref:Wadjet protein JetD C-terminal domain-containing protein n=1 Tax=Pigmentiphaga aceris TaxID=1940612 RepID=A0A5C0B0T7_9BURK|nr:Wadjet anti-phage system protein JetD domain-containing protein [Pigmentiphaga aceris]QEI06720.1 hypothetical protein FXN63_13435 [Pigmentiphaga aceris]
MSDQPWWLDTSEVQALLLNLVAHLEKAELRGSARAQSVALNDKTWPALYRADRESRKEELWAHFRDMCRRGWLSVTPASAATKVSGYDLKPRVVVLDENQLRVAAKRPFRVKSSAEKWKDAVERILDTSDAGKAVAAGYCIDIPERSTDDIVQRLNLLHAIAAEQLLLREVSAKLFWGMSKVLDKRQALVAAVLGEEECPFPASPVQLQVYLPSNYSEVLFIENQVTFERALRSHSPSFSRLALVYASGFKGSAKRLRSLDTCSLFYSQFGTKDTPVSDRFENWLLTSTSADAAPTWFWGDLDYAGMRILAAMRASFPQIQSWKAGYAPMLRHLEEGHGHHPEAADKTGQKRIQHTGCAYADQVLLPAIDKAQKFVDQEAFNLLS